MPNPTKEQREAIERLNKKKEARRLLKSSQSQNVVLPAKAELRAEQPGNKIYHYTDKVAMVEDDHSARISRDVVMYPPSENMFCRPDSISISGPKK